MAKPDPRVSTLPDSGERAPGMPTPALEMARLAAEPTMNPDGSAVVELEDEDSLEVEEQADGSAIVLDDEAAEPKRLGEDFLENLAEEMDPAVRGRIALELLDDVKRDRDARKKRDQLYAEGLDRLGASKDTPGGANFQGASKTVHPMIMESCVDFAARTMKEIFPAKGPVKMQIFGRADREKIARAQRKKDFMNWQTTRQIKELRPTIEIMLTQIPLGGSQYLKIWHDDRFRRPRAEFVPVDLMHLPDSAASFDSAERKAHEQRVSRTEFESRVDSGLYREITRGAEGSLPEKTAAEVSTDKIQGVEDNSYNEDGLRTLFEVYVLMDLQGEDPLVEDGRKAPYIITLDEVSGEMLSAYRNWEEDDERLEELPWIVEGKFLPWRGAQGIGIMHIAGGLSIAATGSLRALLDSAHIENFPGALKLKGARVAGQSTSADPTQITEIEGPVNSDDIRKIAMPWPFKGPSPTLFELLKYLVDAGKGVINTAEERIADASANAPVGTTLALIEQGSITYSSVHARMHEMMRQALEILHRIDRDFLDEEMVVEELGDLKVTPEDFAGPMDVQPVSDPNIFSETQRFAQLQSVLQLRTQFAPGSFNDPVLLERALSLLNFPGYEDVLNTPLEAEELNPLEENVRAREQKTQLKAYPGQDHLAHLKAHVTFMASPIFCANPIMAAPALPKLLEHCKEHLIAYYDQEVRAATVATLRSRSELGLKGSPDTALAVAMGIADKEMAQELEPIFKQLSALQQQMQQLLPPPPDPELGKENIKAQSAQTIEKIRQEGETARSQQRIVAEGQSKAAEAQARAASEVELAKIEERRQLRAEQSEAARHTEEMAISAQNAKIAEESERNKQQYEFILGQLRELAESQRNTQDNQTAVIIEKIKGVFEAAKPQPGADGEAKPAAAASTEEAMPAGTDDLLVDALIELFQAQSQPREYSIQRQPDGSFKLASMPAVGA